MTNQSDIPPMNQAAAANDMDMLNRLKTRDDDVDTLDSDGRIPMHQTAAANDVEDMLVQIFRLGRVLLSEPDLITRALARAKAPIAEISERINVPIMVRKGKIPVKGIFQSDTMFAVFPAGTPITQKPDPEYADSLTWLKTHGMLRQRWRKDFKLVQPVEFVNPAAAMMMIMGNNKSHWLDERKKPINFRLYNMPEKRLFESTGVKVRCVDTKDNQ